MRVALVNGICARHDAISNAIVAEYECLLDKFGPNGAKFYGYALDYPDWNNKIVESSAQILADDYFLRADLVIYHFGIYYELFNALLVGNGRAKQLACYHNVTPKELLGKHHHEVIERSLKQQYNLFFADHIYCDSGFNRDCLVALGLAPQKLSVMGLPVDAQVGDRSEVVLSQKLRLLFIGRVVPSKGVLELVQALQQCLEWGQSNFELKIVGNLRFSDDKYVDEVRVALSSQPELACNVELVGEVDEPTKKMLLSWADVFVLPTHHEGFCVPIVEALAAGCYIIAYNNTNVPNVTGELGTLVNTGDISALAVAISEMCDEWRKSFSIGKAPVFSSGAKSWSRAEFITAAKAWAKQFSPFEHRRKFLKVVEEFSRN